MQKFLFLKKVIDRINILKYILNNITGICIIFVNREKWLLYHIRDDNLSLFVLDIDIEVDLMKVKQDIYICEKIENTIYASCTFTDKRNELIKFIYILLFPETWIEAKNNSNIIEIKNREITIDATIFSRKCLPIWMNENKKEYKEIFEFQFIFWENKRKYIRYRYPVLKEVIWQTKKKRIENIGKITGTKTLSLVWWRFLATR